MTIEECYQEMEGSYAEVSGRLPSLKLVEKFIARFLDDQSFETLRQAMNVKNREEAFRAAHTLKGVCANLSFSRLLTSVSQLTEELRPETDGIPAAAEELMSRVSDDYAMTVSSIRKYLELKEESIV